MPQRRVTLPGVDGVAFILEEGETLDDARRMAIVGGHATAEDVFPRPDVEARTREAVEGVARDLPIVPGFLAGTRARLRQGAQGLNQHQLSGLDQLPRPFINRLFVVAAQRGTL